MSSPATSCTYGLDFESGVVSYDSAMACNEIATVSYTQRNATYWNRAATEDGSAAPSSRSLIIALVIAAIMVLVANEPIISMYIDQFGTWCRRRL